MALPKISLHCILKVWLVLNFLFGFSVGSCSSFVALDWAIFSFTCVCSSESTVLFLFAAFLFLNDSNLVYCCFKDIFFFYSSKNSLKFQVYWSTSINWVLRIDWYFSLFPPKFPSDPIDSFHNCFFLLLWYFFKIIYPCTFDSSCIINPQFCSNYTLYFHSLITILILKRGNWQDFGSRLWLRQPTLKWFQLLISKILLLLFFRLKVETKITLQYI